MIHVNKDLYIKSGKERTFDISLFNLEVNLGDYLLCKSGVYKVSECPVNPPDKELEKMNTLGAHEFVLAGHTHPNVVSRDSYALVKTLEGNHSTYFIPDGEGGTAVFDDLTLDLLFTIPNFNFGVYGNSYERSESRSADWRNTDGGVTS